MNFRIKTNQILAAFIIIFIFNECQKTEWNLPGGNINPAITSLYPYNGQKDVPRNSKIFISFGRSVDENSLMQGFVVTSGNESVSGELYLTPDKRFVKFTPAAELLPAREYNVVLQGLKDAEGNEILLPEDGIVGVFSTGGGNGKKSGKLKVISVTPDEKEILDFSTFRITFSEPVDSSSVGADSFVFKNITSGESVNGTIIVRGTRLVFDPDEDLIPGIEYRLELNDKITGIDGDSLEPYSINFVPLNTNPRTKISLKVSPDSNDAGSDIDTLPFSNIVGIPYNVIEIDSIIIGKTYSIMQGILNSEMADLSNYPDYIPVVIRKGQRIVTSSTEIKLGGRIDTLLDTGEISLTLLTDATGVIRGNPFKNYNKDLPPAVYFTLDACLTAMDPKINALLNQDNVNVQLFGYIGVDGDNMVINTGGTTELDVMGAEKARVTLALRLVTDSEMPAVDVTPPSVTSISPLDGEESVTIDSSVVVTFSEPIKENSVTGKIFVSDFTGNVAGNLSLFGSSVVFRPENSFTPGTAYTVTVKSGIEDLNGNLLQTDYSSTFTTEVFNPDSPQALLVSSIYPGVPCVLKNAESAPPGDAGECMDSDDDGKKFSRFTIPLNREIIVFFTKYLAPESITEESFKVIDTTSSQPVQGLRIVSGKKIIFIPDDHWISGRFYELRLKGGTDSTCDPDEICDIDGLPLNTDILDDSSETPGGTDMVIPFMGGNVDSNIILPLTLLRFSDTNSNGILNVTAPQEVPYPENSVVIRNAADDSILGTTYLSGVMITEIKGYDFSKNAVVIESPPGNWMFGTSTLIIILNSERMLMRPAGAALGFISGPDSTGPDRRPVLNIGMELWMNTVNDLADLALEDAPKLMQLQGRIDFLNDGRMVAQLQNTNTVEINVLGGLITLRINPGDVNVRVQAPVRF
jgi:hypothetical protein